MRERERERLASMEPKSIRLGGSLEVPSVQELAREQLGTVPPRYVRPDQDHPIISDNSSLPQVPIIDLQSLLSGDSKDLELEKLHDSCKEWGFFQVLIYLPTTYPKTVLLFQIYLEHRYISGRIQSVLNGIRYISSLASNFKSILVNWICVFQLDLHTNQKNKSLDRRLMPKKGFDF